MAVYEEIRNLVQYGVNTGLLQESDRIYATNQILEVLGLDEYEEPQGACREISLEETLDALLDYAHETGVLKEDGVVPRSVRHEADELPDAAPERGDWTFLEIV